MVRENRIKSYDFTASDLRGTLGAGSTVDAFTSHPINGLIQSIQFVAGNYAATGSIWIRPSGTTNNIITFVSGTNGNTATSFLAYPRATAIDSSNIAISGANGYNRFVEIPINNVIEVIVSGCGVTKSGTSLTITYI
jgi:hypothetical protein